MNLIEALKKGNGKAYQDAKLGFAYEIESKIYFCEVNLLDIIKDTPTRRCFHRKITAKEISEDNWKPLLMTRINND